MQSEKKVEKKYQIHIIQYNDYKNFKMGTSQSTQPLANELQNYKIIQKYPESNITHLCHVETDKEYLLRQHTYNQQPMYTKYKNQHKSRQAIKDDHLTHLVRVQGKQIDHLCSNLYKIYAIWEYPYRFLSDEINERMYQNRKFQDKQVWSILASAILGLSTLQKNKIKHQMLTTKNLLLDSDGIMKIADPLACGSPTNLDSVFRNRDCEGVYISPQQCQTLQSRGNYSNPYKSDVWIMGLIALQCGLLQNMKKCYKDQFQRIDYDMINTKLQQFGRQYGQQLKMILQLMLRRDNKDRPDWVDLQQYARKSNPSNTSMYNKNQQSPYSNSPSSFTGYSQTLTKPDEYKKVSPRPEIKNQYNFNYQGTGVNNGNIGYSNLSKPTNYISGNNQILSNNSGIPINTNKPPTLTHNLGYNIPTFNTNVPTYTLPNSQLPTFNNQNYTNLPPTPNFVFKASNQTPIHNMSNIQPYYSNLGVGPQTNTSKTMPNYNPSINTNFQPMMRPTEYNIYPSSSASNGGNLFSIPNYTKTETHQANPIKDNHTSSRYQEWKNPTNDIKSLKNQTIKSDVTKPFEKSNYNYSNLPTFTNFPSSKYAHITSTHTSTSTTTPPPPGITPYTGPSGFNKYNNDYSNKSGSLFTSPELLSLIKKQEPNLKVNQYQIQSITTPDFTKLGTQKSNQNLNSNFSKGQNQINRQPAYNTYVNMPEVNTQTIQSITQNINTVESNSKLSYSPQNSIPQKQTAIQPLPLNNKQNQSFDNINHNRNSSSQSSPEKPEYVIQTFKQGSRYEGYKLKDMRHGQGKFFYQDGGMYDGNWVNNMMDGYGSLYYQSGELAYQGMWKQDQFQGKGRLYNQSPAQLQESFNYENFDQIEEYWAYYEGQFVEDFKKGKGVLMLSNGQYFEGNFNNDMVQGPGIFLCKDGKIIQGVWEHNHLVG